MRDRTRFDPAARAPKRKSGDITIEVPAAQITYAELEINWDEPLPPSLRKPIAAKVAKPRKNRGLLAYEQQRKDNKKRVREFCFTRWAADPGLVDRRGETKFVMSETERLYSVQSRRADIAEIKEEFRRCNKL